MQEVFVMLKPDACERFGVAEAIVASLHLMGYKILETEERDNLPTVSAEWLYNEHRDKPHFRDLINYTCSGKVVLMRVGIPDNHQYITHLASMLSNDPVELFKTYVIGDSNPAKRIIDTLRDRFALSRRANSIHCSDNRQAAHGELVHFFGHCNRWDMYKDE